MTEPSDIRASLPTRPLRRPHLKFSAVYAITLAATLMLAPPALAESGTSPSYELGPPPNLFDLPGSTLAIPTPQALAPDGGTSLSVNTANRAEVAAFFNTNYLASENVAMGWTGSYAGCIAGGTSQDYVDATVLRVNFYRAMAGLPANVVLDPTLNVKEQSAALMMSAQGALSHAPGPTWACYSAAGAAGASHSNLSLGVSGPDAIDAYMDDSGSNNYFVGHRRWVLYPLQATMGTGSTPADSRSGQAAANALWVLGPFGPRPAILPGGIAWPPPGFVPYQIVPQASGRWSLSYPSADFSNAVVTMSSGGASVPVFPETQVNGQGYGDNTLVWRPQGIPDGPPTDDTTYSVAIANVVVGGVSRDFAYQVTIFDAAQPATPVPAVTITSPTSGPTWSTTTSPLMLGGTAGDNVGVTQVTWVNDRGGSGTASGTTSWTASGIGLASGLNVITVRAWDAAGNSGTDTLTVTFTPIQLTVSPVPTNGFVSATGVSCGTGGTGDCTQRYAQGTIMTLTGHPATGFRVGTWTGCTPINSNTQCTVAMSQARTMTVTFTPIPFRLTVSPVPTG